MSEDKQLTTIQRQNLLIREGGSKFKKWCSYFLDPSSESYGNATKSALRAYKTKKYHSAGQIGHENLKKLENFGMGFLENDGISVKDWFKIAAKKAMDGTYNDTMDFMERFGLVEKQNNAPANQINQQFNLGNIAEAFQRERKARGLDKNQAETGTDNIIDGSSGNNI